MTFKPLDFALEKEISKAFSTAATWRSRCHRRCLGMLKPSLCPCGHQAVPQAQVWSIAYHLRRRHQNHSTCLPPANSRFNEVHDSCGTPNNKKPSPTSPFLLVGFQPSPKGTFILGLPTLPEKHGSQLRFQCHIKIEATHLPQAVSLRSSSPKPFRLGHSPRWV